MDKKYPRRLLCVAIILLLGIGIGIFFIVNSKAEPILIESPNDVFDEESFQDVSAADRLAIIDESELATDGISDSEQDLDEQGSAAASHIDGFIALNQSPELATGCEITSLTALLNYYSFGADKCDLADNYLDKGPVGTTDPRVAFVGNPRDGSSFGCYAPVIVTTANSYLLAQGSAKRAEDISGTSFSDLFSYINAGTPVIVWGTRYCEVGYYSVTWEVSGGSFTWFTPEHCMVLVGYDTSSNLVSVADPLVGAIVSYDRDVFESRYNDLNQQAVIIQ
ncbi:MAG: C39 family peptidase [Coriobacteriales bacterium]|nr:C39 family peptidase [Coriobacteriales bacterium]